MLVVRGCVNTGRRNLVTGSVQPIVHFYYPAEVYLRTYAEATPLIT